MKQNQYIVRVSRWLLLLLIVIGILFTLAGLDILVLKIVFEPTHTGNSSIGLFIFGIFALLIGIVITTSQVFYFIFPPVMLRITPEGLWFATGFRYKPFFIPIKFLRSVTIYKTESMLEIGGQRRIVNGGVELRFDNSNDIPAALATSAGLTYSDYNLRLFKVYMNRSLQKTVEAVNSFIQK